MLYACTGEDLDNGDGDRDTGPYAEIRTELEYYQLIQNAAAVPVAYRFSNCMLYSQPLNWLYLTGPYYYKFHADQKQYRYVVIGDSSIDYASRYDGFLGADTQSVAVQGNKVCDMLTQLPAINTVAPEAIIISTTGGNDLITGQFLEIDKTFMELFQELKKRFPSSKIIAIAIPPINDENLNAQHDYINRKALLTLQNVFPAGRFCWIDPESVSGNPPSTLLFFDKIHYSPAGASLIKEMVYKECGIYF